jgi:crotonobetainyl-CoA:carnitine CoA-transferase CaiB-like acyl-CoA transferase
VIEVPMLHAGLAFLWPDVTTNVTLQGEFDKLPPQSRTFRLTPTADGYVAMITVTTPQWNGLMRATGRDELVGHPDYDSPQQRGRNGGPLMKEIGAELAQLSTAEVSARLTEQGVPHAAVTDIDDLPEVIERISPGYLVRDVHPEVGELLHPRPAVTFDEPVTVRPAPGLGEHTDEIKAELA